VRLSRVFLQEERVGGLGCYYGFDRRTELYLLDLLVSLVSDYSSLLGELTVVSDVPPWSEESDIPCICPVSGRIVDRDTYGRRAIPQVLGL
jgi:hypothetical protein